MFDRGPVTSPSILVATPDSALPEKLERVLSGLSVRAHHKCLDASALTQGLPGVPDILFISLGGDPPVDLGFLARLAQDAGAIHCPVILSAPLAVMDHLPDIIWTRCDSLLADPDDADIAASVALALGARPGMLSDVSRDIDSLRLQRLADEVGRIARTLATLSASPSLAQSSVADMRPSFHAEADSAEEAGLSAREVRAMIRQRRLRDRFFDSNLFADPAWDMLLDLTAARLERVQVAVSSLCIAACVPPTTALRWIKMMTDSGVFERVADPVDGRRIFIRLSDATAASMMTLLSTVRATQEPLV